MLTVNRKKNIHKGQVDSEGTWAISYGDMITLLLAFFVLFFTVDPEKERSDELTSSLVVALTEDSGADETKKPSEMLNLGDNPGEGIEQRLIDKWGAAVHQVGHKIIIDFPGISFYQLGNVRVNSEGEDTLKRFAEKYMPYSGKYLLGIRAFTDSRPIKYKKKYRDNLELSALRSVSAMRVLRDAGIPLDRMKLGGYGELKVTYDELKEQSKKKYNKDALALARRVVLVIEPEMKRELN